MANNSSGSFSTARIVGGLGLLALACFLMVLDAASPEYAVDTIQLGLVFGTSMLLLGIEAGKRLLPGG